MPTTSWEDYADAFAFIGNSLLRPMTQTEPIGLDPAFWEAFPTFGCTQVEDAARSLRDFAEGMHAEGTSAALTPEEAVSVDYTKLFIGPPKPAAPPWETMNGETEVTVGFGEPAFAMQKVLRDMGLQVSNENNQYADHIGIELLALSEMCRRIPTGDATAEAALSFAAAHPAAWVHRLRGKVSAASPDGYYDRLIALAQALLDSLSKCSAS